MEEIGLSEYIEMIVRRRRTVMVAVTIAVLLGVVFVLASPKTFRGKATLIFPQKEVSSASGILSKLAGVPSVGGISFGGMSGASMYKQILESRTLAEDVSRELGLKAAGLDAEELQDQIEVDTTDEGTLKISCYAPTRWVKPGKIVWLKSRYPGESTKQQTARLAAEITNTYIAALARYDREHALSSGRSHRVFLEGEVKKTREMVEESETKLERFIAAHPSVPPPDAASEQVKEIIDLKSLELQAEAELREAERGVAEAKTLAASEEVSQSVSKVVVENPVIGSLKRQVADAEVTRARLLENFTEKHPDVVAIDQEIEKCREKMQQEVARVTQNETFALNPVRQAVVQNIAVLEIKRSGLEARVQAMKDAMRRVEQGISDRAKDQIEYLRLLRDMKALEMVYTSLLAELSNARVSEAKDPNSFTVLDAAVPEKGQFKPKTKFVLLGCLVLGLMIGSFVAVAQESRRMEKRVRSMGVVSKP